MGGVDSGEKVEQNENRGGVQETLSGQQRFLVGGALGDLR
jgi:hypothetical protein